LAKLTKGWAVIGTAALLAGVATGAVATTGDSSGERVDYPTNERGQTYGKAPAPAAGGQVSSNEFPDLVAAVGDNGVEGYVDVEAVTGGPLPSSPKDALAMQGEPIEYPVYAADGETVVDTFTVNAPSSIPSDPPPDAGN
jgi:hypothetical protein